MRAYSHLMKTFLFALLVALICSTDAFAAIKGQPFIPEVDARFDALEAQSQYPSNYGASGIQLKRVARAVWDFAVQGGSTGNKATNVILPAHALITDSYFYVSTAETGAGSLFGWQCEGSSEIFPQTDITGASYAAGKYISGNQYGPQASNAAAKMINDNANPCNISAKISVAAATAGRIILYVEYVITE